MTYELEVEREHDYVRVGTWMQRKQDDVRTEGGEGVWWCRIGDADVKKVKQCTNWRGRGSVMVSDWGRGCEENRMMYELKVKRECDGVRLGMWM